MSAAPGSSSGAPAGGPPAGRTRRNPVAGVLVLVFRGWQLVRAGRPSPCRFQPTCSTYAIEAVQVHGALRGGYFAVRRLLRCHPWGPFGFDPVPLPHPPHRKVPS